MREIERAVVMEIVPHEPIRNRRLRRHGLQRRMRIDHAGRRIKSRIGDPPHADFAVVVRDILDQPVDRVVGIGRFIDIPGPFLVGIVRSHVDELAFGHHRAPHILIGKNEAFFGQFIRWPIR